MLANFRKQSKPFFVALARPLDWIGLSPDAVTLLSIPLALIAAYFFWFNDYLYGLLFLALSVLFDALDGALAELQHKKTVFGNYLDATVDRITESFFFIGFLPAFPLAAFLAVCGGNLVSYAKSRAGLVVITDNSDWPGIGERSERLILLVIGVVVSLFIRSIWIFLTMELFLWLIVLLTWIGGLNRIRFGKQLIEKGVSEGKLLPYLQQKKQIKK